ncbi:hypothetical protein GCM10025880_24880 [Methylorubrum aminovorans]|nr:hypothetical protein GCM10025880_24880 [Methylorubrum aminovorans]
MAQIQVRLGAVVGDEHLAVLGRAHRAWIDVEVGVELAQAHPVAARLKQRREGGGGETLAEEETTPPVMKTYRVMGFGP